MKRRNRLIMGGAIGLAAIAVAIDHTRHTLPTPSPASAEAPAQESNPCGLEQGGLDQHGGAANPCGLDQGGGESNPCGLD